MVREFFFVSVVILIVQSGDIVIFSLMF